MSEEDLKLLITLDDPEGAPEEDVFNHLPAENTLEYLLHRDSRTNEQKPLIKTTGKNEV